MADTLKITNFLTEVTNRLKPQDPDTGPPLPSGLDISWPGFFARGIKRASTEGLKGPYKTMKRQGLFAEIKKEIELVTGIKL